MPIHFDLPYPVDPARLFAPLAREPWAQWLDSGWPASRVGRHEIMTALPRVTLLTRGEQTSIDRGDGQIELSREDPIALLRAHLGARRRAPAVAFSGGAMGYFGYELGRRLHRLPKRAADSAGWPEMAVGVYDGTLLIDHHTRTCRIWTSEDAAGLAWLEKFRVALEQPPVPCEFTLTGEIETSLQPEAYARAFARVQHYIQAGDCYQVNLAMRFSAPCAGHPWPLYLALRARNPAPFSAWLNFPFGQVLSSSPERFLSVNAGRVETRPIKGTRPRSDDPDEDARRAADLLASEKDRAENLMIVDLLRNDLGQVCLPGSIHVPSLFALERYATVHHLVSTVRGRLAPGKDALHLLAAAFPGGSITGAPKRRAMEIIEELEAQRREVYCGAIGYVGFDGSMDSNIAIRTLACGEGQLRYWAGGGVVADSQAASEYQECLDKARAPIEVLARFRNG